jgi:hypothetical protein
MEEGYGFVNGWRSDRKDPFVRRRLPSHIANSLISLVTNVKLHDYGCTLKAFRREVAHSLHLYGEMHRFIPALVSNLGTTIAEISVNHRPRGSGRSKYGLSRTFRVLLDLVTVKFLANYSTRPIHMFGFLGFLCSFVGGVLTAYLGMDRIFFGQSLSNRPLLLLGILLIVVGIQFVSMGLLGEMMVRIYYETQQKPIYWIREILAPAISSGTSTNGAIKMTYAEPATVDTSPVL